MAVVLGASVNGLSFVRSLGRRGVGVVVVDDRRDVAMVSRYGRGVVLPSIEERPESWSEFLEGLASMVETAPVLFATSDETVRFVAGHAGQLGERYVFLVPDAATVECCTNKRLLHEAATAAGVAMPVTYFPETVDEVEEVAARVAYPCILKPYQSHLARRRGLAKAYVVAGAGELVDRYRELSADDLLFMVQEMVEGDDSTIFVYRSFWDEEGCERTWMTSRKLRQYPPSVGVASLAVTTEAPEILEPSRRLLAAIGFRGFVSVELKRDARTGALFVLEVNARTGAVNQIATTAGVDLPYLGYRHLTSGDAGWPGGEFRRGVRFIHEVWDLGAMVHLRRAGRLTLREWLRSIRGCEARALGAWDDPLPLVSALWHAGSSSAAGRWRGSPATRPPAR